MNVCRKKTRATFRPCGLGSLDQAQVAQVAKRRSPKKLFTLSLDASSAMFLMTRRLLGLLIIFLA